MNRWGSIDLMERAAHALTSAIVAEWTARGLGHCFRRPAITGAMFAVGKAFATKGYQVAFTYLTKGLLSADCQVNRERIESMHSVTFTGR